MPGEKFAFFKIDRRDAYPTGGMDLLDTVYSILFYSQGGDFMIKFSLFILDMQ